jgi:hypothetical protein
MLVAWEVKGQSPPADAIDREMLDALRGESFAKAFDRAYVVRIDTVKDRDRLRERLKGVASSHSSFVNLIVTPPIDSPIRYDGWLPKNRWPEIRRRTHPPLVVDQE